MIAAVLVPFFGLTAVLTWRYADAERRVIEAGRMDKADNLTFLINGEIGAIQAALGVLSTAPELARDDFQAFRTHAEAAIVGRMDALAVIDRSGQQVVSTAAPAGAPLPKTSNMAAFDRAFEGQTAVSDVLTGTVTRRPQVTVTAPVRRDGQVVYVLSGVVYPERFAPLFAQAGVNADWAAAVVDRQGRFVMRNIDPANRIGQTARPELVEVARGAFVAGDFDNTTSEGTLSGNSFRRSTLTGWTAVVSVPRDVLFAPLRALLIWASVAALLLTLACGAVVVVLAERLAAGIRQLSAASTALVEGRPLPEITPYIGELADASAAYAHARKIAEQKRAQDEHVRFLVRELSHRVKNTLAVVQSISNQTARFSASVPEYNARFGQRLRSLGATHDFLFNYGSDGGALDEFIRLHLSPYADASSFNVKVSCKDVRLKPDAVQAIGMALNELATNATKHGALSLPSGKVMVTCAIDGDAADSPLRLEWIESGGPVFKPPEKQGFGAFVIDRMVSAAVGGRADLNYCPDGFRWSLTIAREHFDISKQGEALLAK